MRKRPGLEKTPYPDAFVGWVDSSDAPALHSEGLSAAQHDCLVLWRGFIANKEKLAASLAKAVPNVELTSERSLFAAAYRRWGAALQRHVLGEYCVVIFDQLSHSLFATNDSMGLRPLFYSSAGNKLVCSSHLDVLAEAIGSWELDEQYIGEHLAWARHFGCRTIHRDIRLLEGGHSLVWTSRRGLEIIRTWSLSSVRAVRYRSEAEYDLHFKQLLHEAVSSASSGRTWAELSGGLDSSSIACVAADAGIPDLELISIVFGRSKSADEREWMEPVVAKYGLPWHTLDLDRFSPVSELPDRFIPEPCRAIIVWRCFREYERILRDHRASVVLSGLGGDQVLIGDSPEPMHLADEVLHLRLAKAAGGLRAWRNADEQRRSLLFWAVKGVVQPLQRYALGRALALERGSIRDRSWLNLDFVKRLDLPTTHIAAPKPRLGSVGDQFFYERLWPIALSAGQFWNQLAASFEVRYPLLYSPLVEFMYAIPWDQKLRPGQDRVLQRRALNGILPESVRRRKGKGGPDESFFEGLRRSPAMYSLLTDKPRIVELGYVNEATWKQTVSTARFGRVPSIPCFWEACALEMWLRQFD